MTKLRASLDTAWLDNTNTIITKKHLRKIFAKIFAKEEKKKQKKKSCQLNLLILL